jgi:hypothetical protein
VRASTLVFVGFVGSACGAADVPAAAPTTIAVAPVRGDGGASLYASDDASPPAAPRIHAIDVNFENRIRLVGVGVDPEVAAPGTPVTITLRWRCDDTLEPGWQLFAHLVEDDRTIGVFDAVGSDPSHWEKGREYEDSFSWRVPDTVSTATVTVFAGVWKGDARLRIISGPNDGDNRALALRVPTGIASPADSAAAGPAVPRIEVTRVPAGERVVVDGKGDDTPWKIAASTGPLVDVGTGQPNAAFPVSGSAKLLWDASALYILFDVRSAGPYGTFKTARAEPTAFTAAGQPKLWIRECVEIMIDPDGDGDNKDYYELQVNPQNLVFHSQYDAAQTPMGLPNGPFGHEDWDPKLKSAVVVDRPPRGEARGYVVEAALPWSALTKAAHAPPRPGDEWRMNFYGMRSNSGVAWSPILGMGNFHKASRFGRVTWR